MRSRGIIGSLPWLVSQLTRIYILMRQFVIRILYCLLCSLVMFKLVIFLLPQRLCLMIFFGTDKKCHFNAPVMQLIIGVECFHLCGLVSQIFKCRLLQNQGWHLFCKSMDIPEICIKTRDATNLDNLVELYRAT